MTPQQLEAEFERVADEIEDLTAQLLAAPPEQRQALKARLRQLVEYSESLARLPRVHADS